jgi:hypothetical protein
MCLSRSLCDATAAGGYSLRCVLQFSNLSVADMYVERVFRIHGWLPVHGDIG